MLRAYHRSMPAASVHHEKNRWTSPGKRKTSSGCEQFQWIADSL